MQYIPKVSLFRVAITEFKAIQTTMNEIDLANWCQNQHLILNFTIVRADDELDDLQVAFETMIEVRKVFIKKNRNK